MSVTKVSNCPIILNPVSPLFLEVAVVHHHPKGGVEREDTHTKVSGIVIVSHGHTGPIFKVYYVVSYRVAVLLSV